jgi:hypothetical protein
LMPATLYGFELRSLWRLLHQYFGERSIKRHGNSAKDENGGVICAPLQTADDIRVNSCAICQPRLRQAQ